MMKAVLLDAATLGDDLDLSALHQCFGQLQVHRTSSYDETAARLNGMEVVLSNKVLIDKAHLDATPSIKLIVVLATGYNCVDIKAASALGVTVCNIRDYSTPSVVQHTLLLILALLAKLPEHSRAIAAGEWQRSKTFSLLSPAMTELAGKTVLIVGYGVLGQAIAAVLDTMGAKVKVAIRPGSSEQFTGQQDNRVALDIGLAEADIVTVHCQLSEQTEHLFDTRRLALMKPTAVLVNTARGGIIDEQALAQSLLAGRLGGAGIDVLATEPPCNHNPLLQLLQAGPAPSSGKLSGMDKDINLIVTPHCAWATFETRCRLLGEAIKVVKAFEMGQAINQITL